MTQDAITNKKYEEDRSKAVGFGMTVYTGGVVAATAIFIFFILTAFPESAYFIRFLMVIAALCVGASALAFRFALENWAVLGTHRKAAIWFYYGEIFLVSLNTVVSFAALLYSYGGNDLPDWVAWYEPFTIITIAYVILAWGTLFALDPRSKSKAKQIQVLLDFDDQVVSGMQEYLESEDGRLAIKENANQRIRDNFSVRNRAPAPWMGPKPSSETPGIPALPSPAPIGPGILPPRIAPKSSYTLDSLLASIGKSPEEARDLIRHYGLWDAMTAYTALHSSGYLPAGITQSDFMPLFCELFGVAPTWGSIAGLSVPPASAAAPGGNGASNKSF